MASVLHLEPNGLAEATAFFNTLSPDMQKEFGSAERMIATLWIAPNDPTRADTLTGAGAIGEGSAYGALMLVTEWQFEDGTIREKSLPFHDFNGAWSWGITPGIVHGLITQKGSGYSSVAPR
jgi:hypothetical protein